MIKCVWCGKEKPDKDRTWIWAVHYRNGKRFDEDVYCPECSKELNLTCENCTN